MNTARRMILFSYVLLVFIASVKSQSDMEFGNIINAVISVIDEKLGGVVREAQLLNFYTGAVENLPLSSPLIPLDTSTIQKVDRHNTTAAQSVYANFVHKNFLKSYIIWENNGTMMYYGTYPTRNNAPIWVTRQDFPSVCSPV
jgi:hypothetical protein